MGFVLSCCGQNNNNPYKWVENGEEYSVTQNEMRDIISEQMKEMAKQMNAQSPLVVDEVTTLMSTIYVNNEIQHNYRINIDSSKLSEAQKNKLIESMTEKQATSMKYLMVDANVDLMPRSEWLRLYKELGIKFVYNMRDNKGIVFGRVILDYTNF